jgi:hypothetical protein
MISFNKFEQIFFKIKEDQIKIKSQLKIKNSSSKSLLQFLYDFETILVKLLSDFNNFCLKFDPDKKLLINNKYLLLILFNLVKDFILYSTSNLTNLLNYLNKMSFDF